MSYCQIRRNLGVDLACDHNHKLEVSKIRMCTTLDIIKLFVFLCGYLELFKHMIILSSMYSLSSYTHHVIIGNDLLRVTQDVG
jgi:hypothetical protein